MFFHNFSTLFRLLEYQISEMRGRLSVGSNNFARICQKKEQKKQEKLLSQGSENTVGRVTVNTALHSLALVIIFIYFQIGASILPSALCSEIQWSPNSYSEKMQVYEVSIFIDILFLEIELIY